MGKLYCCTFSAILPQSTNFNPLTCLYSLAIALNYVRLGHGVLFAIQYFDLFRSFTSCSKAEGSSKLSKVVIYVLCPIRIYKLIFNYMESTSRWYPDLMFLIMFWILNSSYDYGQLYNLEKNKCNKIKFKTTIDLSGLENHEL